MQVDSTGCATVAPTVPFAKQLAAVFAQYGEVTTKATLDIQSNCELECLQRASNATNVPYFRGAALASIGGNLYIVGGRPGPTEPGATNNLRVFSPSSGTTIEKAPMPTYRKDASVSVIDGLLYVLGGRDANSGSLRTLEAYDPATDAWTTRASAPLFVGGSAAVGKTLYSISSTGSPTLWAYDVAVDSWRAETTIPIVSVSALAAVDGKVYVVDRGAGIQIYDPASKTWTTRAIRGSPAFDNGPFKAAPMGEKIYFFGSTYNLYALDLLTGIWSHKGSSAFTASAAIGGNGVLYVFVRSPAQDPFDNTATVTGYR